MSKILAPPLAHGHRILGHARTQLHRPTQTDRIRTERTSVWDRVVELALQICWLNMNGQTKKYGARVDFLPYSTFGVQICVTS